MTKDRAGRIDRRYVLEHSRPEPYPLVERGVHVARPAVSGGGGIESERFLRRCLRCHFFEIVTLQQKASSVRGNEILLLAIDCTY